jgi:hypothetical protein
MKQLHHVYVFLPMLVWLAFQSCIREDLSNCLFDKRIYFDYEQASPSLKGGIDPADITQMNLFIFDEDGRFVMECVDEAPQMGAEYFMTVKGLKPGNYRMAAWGNLKERYALSSALVPGQTTFADLQVMLSGIENGEVKEPLTPLFFATHAGSASVEVMGKSAHFIRLELIKDTYKINVTVSGMDSTRTEQYDHELQIADNNGAYRFDNDFADCRTFRYTQPCRINRESNNDLEASLTVLRLAAGRQPLLSLINRQTGGVVVQDDLVKLILDANAMGATIDFSKTHEFDVRYELSRTSAAEVVVYINGWRLIRQPGVLD